MEKVAGNPCQFCGSKLVKSPKTGKVFCSDKCWLKNAPQSNDSYSSGVPHQIEQTNALDGQIEALQAKVAEAFKKRDEVITDLNTRVHALEMMTMDNGHGEGMAFHKATEPKKDMTAPEEEIPVIKEDVF